MFVDVKAFFLNACRNSQAVYLVEQLEDDVTHRCSPGSDDQGTEKLCTEESPAGTVEQTFAGREESCQDGTCKAAYTVYGAGTNGIVYFQDLVDELYCKNHQYATDESDNGGTSCRYTVATGRDADQTGQNAVQGE